MRRALLVALAVTLPLAMAESTSSIAAGTGKHVTVTGYSTPYYGNNYAYSPQTVTIRAGRTVHWSWSSDRRHDVTWNRSGKHSATVKNLQDYARTFKNVGTFRYH